MYIRISERWIQIFAECCTFYSLEGFLKWGIPKMDCLQWKILLYTWMIRGNPRLRKPPLIFTSEFPSSQLSYPFWVCCKGHVTRLIADYPPNYGHIWRSTSAYLTRLRSGHVTSTCNLTIMQPHPIFRVR